MTLFFTGVTVGLGICIAPIGILIFLGMLADHPPILSEKQIQDKLARRAFYKALYADEKDRQAHV